MDFLIKFEKFHILFFISDILQSKVFVAFPFLTLIILIKFLTPLFAASENYTQFLVLLWTLGE